MKRLIIGIDVSKMKLDLCVFGSGKLSQELVISNITSDLMKFFKQLVKKHNKSDLLVCAEYTGHYTYPLCLVCDALCIDLWLESPYQIKHSSGLVRGKNDKLDARRIAEYACRFQDKCCLFSFPDKNIASLKSLVSERDICVSHKSTFQGQLTDQKRFMSKSDYADKSKRLNDLIKALDKSISAIDKKIEKLIASDATLSNLHKLLCSIDGIGTVIATKMIVITNAFRDFDNARQFECYAGVAPFVYTSGSSIGSKSKVSQKANKNIKKLLHMAALVVATRKKDGELREYYLRKIAEGKNSMSVLNAIRAKLIARMFAVVRENRTYAKNYQFEF
jgi:transposase